MGPESPTIIQPELDRIRQRLALSEGGASPAAIAAAVAAALAATLPFANFFALMPPDNGATVAPGAPVLFPQDGPTSGAAVRATAGTFTIPVAGTYLVSTQVSFSPAGQLALAINGVKVAATQIGRATSTTQGVISTLITVNAGDILSVINPGSHATALIITPNAGGDVSEGSVSATLTIRRLG